MKKNTLEDYKKSVKTQYDLIKEVDVSGLLNNPSPANIRELCVLTAGEKMTKDDEVIFIRFFDIREGESIVKHIAKFDIDKLRPVGHYLKNKTKDTKPIIIELIAILIDFTPRPFRKFSKDALQNETDDVKSESNNELEELSGNKNPGSLFVGNPIGVHLKKSKSSLKKKITIGITVIGIIFSVGYTSKQFILTKKECMQWEGDHYELVDCKSDLLEIANTKRPYNEIEFNRKKLRVCDTFTFFRNNEAVVWYGKKDNIVEFFNMDGKNPENGCELKQVTQYMIDKYVPPCK